MSMPIWATTGRPAAANGPGAADCRVPGPCNDKLYLIFERFRAFDTWTSRAGVRFNLTPTISVDLSAARSGPDGVRGYAIGLNQVFSR